MVMQTIVFIGTNKSGTSREAIVAAAEMGFSPVLLTDRKKFLQQRMEFPEVNEMLYVEDLLDRNRVIMEIQNLQKKRRRICACISLIDPFISLAARLSAELGLVHLSTEALFNMEDKVRVRELLKDLRVNPNFDLYRDSQPISLFVQSYKKKLPLIIKSPVSNGSKDVLFVKTKKEFTEALTVLQEKNNHIQLLVEEYVEGPQFLIEVIVFKGQMSLVAVIEQEIQLDKRFIVTGYKYPAKLKNEEYESLTISISKIIQRLKMENGICHLEMRKIGGQWKLIEINPRVSGGAMNRIILEGTGINYVKEIIKLYLGEEPVVHQTKSQHVYARFLTINTRGRLLKVTGKNRALKREGIKEVYIKPKKGTILTNPYSLGDRYAYVIAASDTVEDAKRKALDAAQEIKFYLEPL